MAELLAVPLKKPTDVDVVQPLKNTINIIYSTSQKAQDYTEQVNEFSKLRNNAVWKAYEKYESSLEVIYSYYDQLVAIESKIPPGELQIPFKWKDAFSKGSGLFGTRASLTISQLGYERVCVLFNIAALQSSVAASQSMDSDEGLKLAAKLFQQSAGIFGHLKGSVMAALQQDPTPDLQPDTLAALSSLMLAQAQEIFVHKAIHDNFKEAITAKLANQAEELYADALKLLQKDRLVQTLWDKDWISIVAGKQAMFHGMAEYYQSLVCKSNKAVGEEIARLQSALEFLKAAQTRSGKPSLTADLVAKAERHLKEAIKDNDFIYHERIPDAKSLTPIGRAPLAKAQPIPPRLSSNFKDLFEQLVPMAVHQALTAYENHKGELVNSEVAKLRDATQLLNSVLASLNLPAALEDTSGQELPPSLVAKASAVQERGGITNINNMLRELPELLTRNREILDETERMLNDEKQSDDQLREQFKDKWTRIPSARLTETFRANMEKYRAILNNAAQADKTVRDKYETHKRGMELLSEGPSVMAASVPHAGGVTSKSNNSTSAGRLRQLMDQVETMKAERDAIECELKSASVDMKEKFLTALHDGNINEHALTVETLGRAYGPLQQQVKDSLNKQEGLLAEIQKTNTEFVAENSAQGHAAQRREAVLKELAAAHDACMELLNNLGEGTKFYNSLTELLLAFQNKVSDFCFARKTEKEELMKDLTRGLGAVAQAVAPNLPQHHGGVTGITSAVLTGVLQTGLNTLSSYLASGGGKEAKSEAKSGEPGKNENQPEGKKEPPPRPPPPSTAPQAGAPQLQPQLPYPMAPQNMPIPYAPGPQVPYPQYTVPAMPPGYYTLPFPAGYQPPQQYPGYPPPPQYPVQYPPPQGQQPPPQNRQW